MGQLFRAPILAWFIAGSVSWSVSAASGAGYWRTYDVTDGLAGVKVSSLFQGREGYIWFGTQGGGVSRYDGQMWKTYTTEDGLADNFVLSIFQDREGVLWVGTDGGGVSRYDGLVWKTYTTEDGLVDNRVRTIVQDRDGVLWFGTDGGGVSRYDGLVWKTYTTEDGLADNRVRTIVQDREGRLWFGTSGGGISRYDGRSFTTYTTADGLAHNWVVSAFQDREGHLWVGSDGGGVSRYSESYHTFTEADGLASNVVLSIFQDREGLFWVGSDGGGVSRYDGKGFTTFTTADGLAHNRVRAIFQDRDGVLWFGTDGGGASRYDGKAFTTFTTDDGLASNHIYSIFQDREGDLWFGTGGFPDPGKGVSRYDGKVWKTYTTQDGLPDLTVSAVTQDREGHLWFGTANGVSRYDGQTMTQYTTADGLAHNRIRTIYPDREGHLWFGTEHGVSRYDGKGFETFTTKDGLADNQVRSIYQDREGHLWIGTLGGGVSRYDGRIFQKITHQDGLGGNGVYSILQDREGHLWFGTLGGGVTRYTPSLPVHPPTFIDAVVAGRRYEGVPELSVPSSVGLVAFEFHGISFKTRPDAMVYRYRLKGHDKDWRITHRRRVEYLDVPTGTYTFEVQAVDRDLVYSKRPATVSLEVYYQPMSSSVQISELVVQDVFASFYKTYAKASIGSMRVSNNDPNPVEAKVSFYIPDFMGRPTEQTVVLKPHSVQQIPLRAILKPEVLDLKGDMSVQAEVALSCKVSEHTISVKEFRNIVIHGRGVLSWDSLGRAAAFVTPEDPNVSTFARGLYDAYRHQIKGSPSAGNIPTAMLMFEALNTHGIKYAQDSSTPYSQARADRSVLDNIQYPSELLHSKLGDCDDCTVLYCSLLENLNIPTAFVDAPAHILMIFDSGVTTQRAFGFRLDEDRYILRGDRFWIPVEVTKLGEGSFMEAWELGMKICRRLEAEGGLRITDVREGWTQYPYVLPTVDGEVQLPDAEGLERFFLSNVAEFHRLREDYVKRRYILRLIENPDDHVRRIELAQTKIESEDYNDAITAVLPLLHSDDYQDYANYLIGCAYAGQDDFETAAQYFERALEQDPGNPNYERGLEVLKAWIQRQKGGIAR